MPQIVVLPHESLCPEGAVLEVRRGITVCDALLENEIEIEHACEKSCACTTCHVIVREGYASLNEAEEKEEDLLDMAWGLEATSMGTGYSGDKRHSMGAGGQVRNYG